MVGMAEVAQLMPSVRVVAYSCYLQKDVFQVHFRDNPAFYMQEGVSKPEYRASEAFRPTKPPL